MLSRKVKFILNEIHLAFKYYANMPIMEICKERCVEDLFIVHLSGKNIYLNKSAQEIIEKDRWLRYFNEIDQHSIIDAYIKMKAPLQFHINKIFTVEKRMRYRLIFPDSKMGKPCEFYAEELASNIDFFVECFNSQ